MEMKTIKEIALKSDGFYKQAKELGEIAASLSAFGERHRAQITNLENIASSTWKFSDVLDYIKRQIARSDKSQRWRFNNFGNRLKEQIENEISEKRDEICKDLNIDENPAVAQQVYLALIREFIHQVAVHYEYTLTEGG